MCYLNTILKYTLKLSREAQRKFLSKYLEADAKRARKYYLNTLHKCFAACVI